MDLTLRNFIVTYTNVDERRNPYFCKGLLSVYDFETKSLLNQCRISNDVDFKLAKYNRFYFYSVVSIIKLYDNCFISKKGNQIGAFALHVMAGHCSAGYPPYFVYHIDGNGKLTFSHAITEMSTKCRNVLTKSGVNIEIDYNGKGDNEFPTIIVFDSLSDNILCRVPMYNDKSSSVKIDITDENEILVQVRNIYDCTFKCYKLKLSISRFINCPQFTEKPIKEYYRKIKIKPQTINHLKKFGNYFCGISNCDLVIYDQSFNRVFDFAIPSRYPHVYKSANDNELYYEFGFGKGKQTWSLKYLDSKFTFSIVLGTISYPNYGFNTVMKMINTKYDDLAFLVVEMPQKVLMEFFDGISMTLLTGSKIPMVLSRIIYSYFLPNATF